MNRAPLPSLGLGHRIATDHLTGDTSPNVVYRKGKWWTQYRYAMTERDRDRDLERLRLNRLVGDFLRAQKNDPGL